MCDRVICRKVASAVQMKPADTRYAVVSSSKLKAFRAMMRIGVTMPEIFVRACWSPRMRIRSSGILSSG
jgi:ATP sulfurylase